MIKLVNATKKYFMGGATIKALDNVNLEIEKGQFVVVIGPSGSGKSTLLHMIGGIDFLDGGKVIIFGKDISKLGDKELARFRNKSVGFVFQNFYLQSRYTALENVELPLVFCGINKNEREKIAIEALKKVGLEKKLHNKPNQLSGGQQQKVCIARAIVNNPEIILADEPTGNLDSLSGKKIINLLKKINKEFKVTVVVVTHDENISKVADRKIKIIDGKIIEDKIINK